MKFRRKKTQAPRVHHITEQGTHTGLCGEEGLTSLSDPVPGDVACVGCMQEATKSYNDVVMRSRDMEDRLNTILRAALPPGARAVEDVNL